MSHEFQHPVIGQQVVVYPGSYHAFLGIVTEWRDEFPYQHVRVRHPVTGSESDYAPHNVQIEVAPTGAGVDILKALTAAKHGLRNWEVPQNRYDALEAVNAALTKLGVA